MLVLICRYSALSLFDSITCVFPVWGLPARVNAEVLSRVGLEDSALILCLKNSIDSPARSSFDE